MAIICFTAYSFIFFAITEMYPLLAATARDYSMIDLIEFKLIFTLFSNRKKQQRCNSFGKVSLYHDNISYLFGENVIVFIFLLSFFFFNKGLL